MFLTDAPITGNWQGQKAVRIEASRLEDEKKKNKAPVDLEAGLRPAGLACRVHLQDSEPAVRPETLLPMAAQELADAQVQRLLSVQSLVLSELGWYLSTSPEGLLQLSSLSWIAR